MATQTKRVYDPPAKGDGTRILVERLWPRGIKKDELKFKHWIKEVAPSTGLRKWFSHDPKKWPEFKRKYFSELDHAPDAWKQIIKAGKNITLLYSSRDTEHNNAVALREYLEKKSKQKHPAK